MKSLVFLSMILATSAAPASATDLMNCGKIRFLDGQSGKLGAVMEGASLRIFASAAGKRGYEAEASSPAGTFQETDVDVTESSNEKEVQGLKEVAAAVVPELDYAKVKSVRAGNIGVEANRTDGAGAGIFELKDAQGTVLAKLVQNGWSFGLCGE